ncbi:MAG TPA: ABC transporter substrate-binding protein [Candidatus Cybelea sp.]|nr:ABC transporter substrate-binding protein [Candidatus Cybelea sp.]
MHKARAAIVAVSLAAAALAAVPATAADKVVWKTQGVSRTEILFGVHTDLSGPGATFGVGTTNSFRLRADEVNAAGGIYGRRIRLVIEDTQYQVPKAVQAVNKLVNLDHVFAIVGGAGTPMNNAVMPELFAAGVPNLFPVSAARQMYEPFHPLKFSAAAPYYHQIRAGVKYLMAQNNRSKVCVFYQDTDFGKEILEGVQDELKALNKPLVETATDKPTDTDFTSQLTKLRAAGCDLIAMGSIVRDSIIPYAATRKMGWNVEMIGTSASYDLAVSGAQGGVTEGYYTMGQINPPYRDNASPQVLAWMDAYKAKYGTDPTIASALGYVFMDFVVFALDRAGPDLTTKSLVQALESINGYRDIFGGPEQSFSPTKHLSTMQSMLFVVHQGRWVRVTDPLSF